MGSQLSKDYLRALIVPYPLSIDEFWNSQATGFSFQDPIPDQPVPDSVTKLNLNSTGECLTSTDLQVITRRSGLSSKAKYTVRDNVDSVSIEYGHNPPVTISDWDLVKYGGTTQSAGNPDILGLENNSYIVVFEYVNLSLSTKSIRAQITDSNRSVTDVTIANLGAGVSFANEGKPAICVLADGSLLLVYLYIEADQANVKGYRSTDDGETWTFIGSQLLNSSIDVSSGEYTIQKMRIAHVGGQTLIIIGTYYNGTATNKNQMWQFASVDNCNFELINEDKLATEPLNRPDLCIYQNQFCIGYGLTDKIRYVSLPHAFYKVQDMITAGKYVDIEVKSANSFAAGTDANMTTGMVSIFSNSNNELISAFTYVSQNQILLKISTDGVNWPDHAMAGGIQSGSLFFIDTDSILTDYRIGAFEGALVFAHSWYADTATNDFSVAVATLGGYSNVEAQPVFENREDHPNNTTTNRVSYLPIEELSDCSIFVQSGLGRETLGQGFTTIEGTGGAGNDITFTRTQNTYPDEGLTVRGVIQVVNDASGTAPLTVQTIIAKNPDLYSVTVEFFAASIEVNGSSISFDCTQKTEFIIEHTLDKFNFYYRAHSNANLRKFTTGFSNQTATSGTSAQTRTQVIINTEITASQFKLYQFMISDIYARSTAITGKQTIGRRYPIAGRKSYIHEGVSISANGGTTYNGEGFTIQATSLYGKENILYAVSPSPRVLWRSTSVVSGSIPAMRIPFQLSSGAISLGNDLIGFNLHNINFQEFKLQYYNGASWVDIATFDSANDMQHGCIIRGKTLVQNAGGGAVIDRNYYFYNELKGYIAKITTTGEGGGTEYIRIQSNTEGVFGDSNAKACVIRLEEDPSTSASTGTLEILSPYVAGVINLNSVYAEAFAIYITSQETIDNDFRIGAFNIGAVAVTGQQYSKGRRISIEAGSIQTVQQDRTIYTKNIAPDQRTIQISWSDGVDISTLYDSNPDPDYYKSNSSGGSQAVSNFADVPYMVEGILREVEGGVLPLVYLPSIATNTDTRLYNRRHQFLYSYLNSDVQIDSVTGDELLGNGIGEVMRVATIDLLEIV